VTVLSEIAAAAGPSLAPYAVPEPAPPRFDGALGDRQFVLEAVYEGYLLHYGRSRGTLSTRSVSPGSRRAATCRPWRSCPT